VTQDHVARIATELDHPDGNTPDGVVSQRKLLDAILSVPFVLGRKRTQPGITSQEGLPRDLHLLLPARGSLFDEAPHQVMGTSDDDRATRTGGNVSEEAEDERTEERRIREPEAEIGMPDVMGNRPAFRTSRAVCGFRCV